MTKADESRQLSVKQQNAIDFLVTGRTDTETAELIGVTRQTVNQWKNQDKYFAAELASRRVEIWGAQLDRLRNLISQAIDVLADELTSDNPKLCHAAAVAVLRVAGFETLQPDLKTDPEDIRVSWESAAQERFLTDLSNNFQAPPQTAREHTR